MPRANHAFSGLILAIEGEDARTFKNVDFKGKIVEIDPHAMRGDGWSTDRIKQYVADLKAMGATPQVYLPGGHISRSSDGASYNDGTFQTGPTGNWRWDKDEKRILDITSPASLARTRAGVKDAFNLGIPLIRIDNLHNPGGAAAPRTAQQLKVFADMVHQEEDLARQRGVIKTHEVAGITAHNNHVEWEKLIASGGMRRLPVWLTTEKSPQQTGDYSGDERAKAGRLTPQDIPDIAAAQRMAAKYNLPYAIVDAKHMDDAGRAGKTYPLPKSYSDALTQLPHVSQVILLNGEANYAHKNVAEQTVTNFRPTLGDTRNYVPGAVQAPAQVAEKTQTIIPPWKIKITT